MSPEEQLDAVAVTPLAEKLANLLRVGAAIGATVAIGGVVALGVREATVGDVVQVCTTTPQGAQHCQ